MRAAMPPVARGLLSAARCMLHVVCLVGRLLHLVCCIVSVADSCLDAEKVLVEQCLDGTLQIGDLGQDLHRIAATITYCCPRCHRPLSTLEYPRAPSMRGKTHAFASCSCMRLWGTQAQRIRTQAPQHTVQPLTQASFYRHRLRRFQRSPKVSGGVRRAFSQGSPRRDRRSTRSCIPPIRSMRASTHGMRDARRMHAGSRTVYTVQQPHLVAHVVHQQMGCRRRIEDKACGIDGSRE